jgi:hypothetical protein
MEEYVTTRPARTIEAHLTRTRIGTAVTAQIGSSVPAAPGPCRSTKTAAVALLWAFLMTSAAFSENLE